jgi:adhesin transport system membrane fusion protein
MKSWNPFKSLRNLSMMALLFLGLLIFGSWAAFFEINQSVRAQGQVIASARTQIIQAVDGGVLSALSVTEGQAVQAGQLLAVLEKNRAQAGFEESYSKAASLSFALMRAQAESHLKAMPGPGAEPKLYPNFYQAQLRLYKQHRRTLDEDLASLGEALAMAREELRMNDALFKSGDVSQLDILRSRRQVNEFENRVSNARNKYQQDASAEAAKIEEELASVNSRLKERQSILDHTDLIAPVGGIVKLLRVTTIGGVLRPGDELMQIVPDDEALIVEAKVIPSDIGQLSPGLPVSIKMDAFDYSIYGALNGTLTYISPDTISEQGPNGQSQTYYRVHIKLAPLKGQHAKAGAILIKPGMTASLDIQTGTRSILKYLAKPLFKAFSGAMTER